MIYTFDINGPGDIYLSFSRRMGKRIPLWSGGGDDFASDELFEYLSGFQLPWRRIVYETF